METLSTTKIKEALEILKSKRDNLLAEQKASLPIQEETTNISSDKNLFFTKNKLGALLAGLIAIGGGSYGIKQLGKKGDQNTKEKIENKDTQEKTTGVFQTSATNMTEETERLKNNKAEEERIEKITKSLQEKFNAESATRDAEYAKKLEAIEAKVAPVAPPKPVTKEELIAGIEQKIMLAIKEGKDPNIILTADEASLHNQELMRGPSKIVIGNEAQIDKALKSPPENKTGYNFTYTTPPGFDPNIPNFQVPVHPEKTLLSNPFNLTPKMLERVEEVYEESLEKIFLKDTLHAWRSIKDKSVYAFMNISESKVKKDQKLLRAFLEKFRKIGIEPRSGARSGKPQSIEQFIQFALEKAAKEGKLEEVRLK